MSAQIDQSDVLIIGAGPTGLTLACTLAQRGVRLRIVDAFPTPPIGSRGKGTQPRSLELFDDLGIVNRVIANGRFGLPVRAYDETGQSRVDGLDPQAAARFDVPYLSALITPQWRVEQALRNKLEALGTRVEFGIELIGLEQDSSGVSAQLKGPTTDSVRARWIVGCDGGKSSVRHLAGIAFLGETSETYRMLVGDVCVAGIDREHWHIWRSAEGFLGLCPLPSTDAYQLQASIAPGQPSEPSLEVFQELVACRTGRADIRLSSPAWMSLWRANVRMVDRYRAGRIFLAGDAAHVHSPAGGQGMNTGIQDAYNLGWKMAAVLDGADPQLLDTYQEERLPIAAAVLGLSNELMAATVAAGTIAFRRDERTLQTALGYRGSSLAVETRSDVQGMRAGDRAPEAPGLLGQNGTARMFDLLRGPHVTLLGFGSMWRPLIDSCKARFADRLQGYVITAEANGESLPDSDYTDGGGHARAAYADNTLFVVRPDNYVGLATSDVDPHPVMAYLSKITGHG